MSILTLEELERALQRNQFHPVYLVVGPEEYFRQQALGALRRSLLKDSVADFDYQEFSGGKNTAEQILQAVNTMPMMSPRRVVVVRSCEDLDASGLESLRSYLDQPNRRSTLILEAQAMDRRTTLYKAFTSSAQVVEAPKLKGHALASWAQERIRKGGRHIAPEALRRLIDLVGADLQVLQNEIEKLLLYTGNEKSISAAAVDAMIAGSRQHSIFELTDALGRKDRQSALRSLGNLLDSGDEPPRVLSMMARHYRQVLIAKEMLAGGHSPREIGLAAQIPEFLLSDFLRRAKGMDRRTAENLYIRLGAIDRRMKSTGSDERGLLERLIFEMPAHPDAGSGVSPR